MDSRLTKLEGKLQEATGKITDHEKQIEELKSAVSFTEHQYKKVTGHINNLTDGNHRLICRLEEQLMICKTEAAETMSLSMVFPRDRRATSHAKPFSPISFRPT